MSNPVEQREDVLLSERFGALPLGELHAEGVCYRCGAKGEIEWRLYWRDPDLLGFDEEIHTPGQIPLKRTVNAMTQAIAEACFDTTACERRRYKAKL